MKKVRELVRKGQTFSSEYGGTLADHLPMCLFALSGLGSTSERLDSFYQFYIKRLVPKGPKGTGPSIITQDDWQSLLGKHTHHAEWVDFFTSQEERLGTDMLLSTYLPSFLEGPGTGAFHGLIRTAYGVEFQEASEIAEGLAYWALAFLNPAVPFSPTTSKNKSPMALIAEAVQDPTFFERPTGNNIVERMNKVYTNPRFGYYCTGEPTLKDLAAATLLLYSVSNDFTNLHAVTSTQALRILLPFVVDTKAALKAHWRDLLAAALTIPLTGEQRKLIATLTEKCLTVENAPSWEDIKRVSVASNDDHVCKFSYTCMKEEEVYGWNLYRTVAAKKAGLVGIVEPSPRTLC